MPAFDTDSYQQQYGPGLSQIAGFDAMSGAGGVDATDQGSIGEYDQDQERNLTAANNANPGAAPLPSPYMQQRQMGNLPPPPGAKLGHQDSSSPQSSGAFYDPTNTQGSAPVYHAVDNLSEDQAKAHVRDIDERAAADDRHDSNSFNDVYDRTFKQSLKDQVDQAGANEETASKMMNPTWRDKLSMFLDATNRASAIHAQNPQMSKGDIWAVATRGALDGWQAHVTGLHDSFMEQQRAFHAQATKDADAAVKRQSDQLGLQDKSDALLEKQRADDETKRHNMADEAINSDKAKATAAKDSREGAAKGDLVTGDDGYLRRIGPDGKATMVKDADGNPVKGSKTGTKTSEDKDSADRKNATAALDKIMAGLDKDEAAKAKDPMNLGKYTPMTTEDKRARAMEMLRTQDPKSYKALQGDQDVDTGAPAPAKPAAPQSGKPPKRDWQQS
jgi:hypothetical protein